MKIISYFFFSLVALLSCSITFSSLPTLSPEKQCQTNGIAYQAAKTFVKNFQSALKKHDVDKISKMMHYPLRINAKNGTSYIKNKKAFSQKFNTIFTKRMQAQLLQATTTNIFCNYQGAMISDGAIWFNTNNDSSIKIISINIEEI